MSYNSICFPKQVQQLSDQVGEEAVLLTASVSDGSFSHLGSESGKVFVEDHDEIKSQFLGHCLKSEFIRFIKFSLHLVIKEVLS